MNTLDKILEKQSSSFSGKAILKGIRYVVVIAFLGISLTGCLNLFESRDVLFQTSTFYALSRGVYDGDLTYRDLKKHGDFGIGTFNGLDGEMIGMDGEFYQIRADGVAYPADDSVKTPFATVTFFESDKTTVLDKPLDCRGLEEYLDKLLPTKNLFYAIKIEGVFPYIKTRSVPRQNKPYLPLVEVLKDQTLSEFHNIKGTIAGFRLPDYMNGINVQGYHFHFITEDRNAGGHLLECRIQNAKAEIDYTAELHIALPKPYKADVTKEGQKNKGD